MPDDFKPIPRDTCSECGRASSDYYDARKVHMAAAFRSGVPAQTIARAYGISGEWAMNLITEQMGREAVVEVQQTYWSTDERLSD